MFVGMDVHKESIDISLAEEGRDGEVRHYGGIPGVLEALAKVVTALRAPTRRLRFVYEAGPCGFGIHRYLTGQGKECVVVNPSSMPKRSGDRIKTDRRFRIRRAPSGACRVRHRACRNTRPCSSTATPNRR
jgi:transposase